MKSGYGQAMFNLGILFTLAQGVREPIRSALLDQIFRIMDNIEQGGNTVNNMVSIKCVDGSRIEVNDFNLDKALAQADDDDSIWLEVPTKDGYKLIAIDHIVSISVKVEKQ